MVSVVLRLLASAIENGVQGLRRAGGSVGPIGLGSANLGSFTALTAAGFCCAAGLVAVWVAPDAAALPTVLLSAFGTGTAGLLALVLARSGQTGDGSAPQGTVEQLGEQPDQPQGPWLTITRTGVVCEANRSAGDIAAFDNGDQMLDRVHVSDRVAWMRALSQVHDTSAGAVAIDIRLNRAGHETRQDFVPVRLVLWRHPGDVIAIVIAAKADDQAEPVQSDTMIIDGIGSTAGGTHLAMVGHELRTPLNAIIGFSELLRGDAIVALPADRQREYVTLINGAATHLLSIVNAMLDVSKIGAGRYVINRESFDLRATVHEVADMILPRASEKGTHLNLHLEKISGNAFADRRAIKQILINLVSNAVKFTPDQGCVTLEAETHAHALVLRVADTGIGIAAEDLHRLGQPFHQVDNSYTRRCEGTGLGLSLVKGLVGLHGGDVQMESTPDVGTQVTVTIPFDDAQAADRPSEQSAPIAKIYGIGAHEGSQQDEGNEDAPRRYG